MKTASVATIVYDKTGIAMSSLAAFAKVHPSLLCRSEKGLRSLPAVAALAMVKLYLLASTVEEIPLPANSESENEELLNDAAWCRAQCHPLQKKLAAARKKYRQAYTTLQVLTALDQESDCPSAKEKRWLENQRYDAQKKLEKYGRPVQEKLHRAITLLEYEAALLKKAVKK